MRRMALLTCLAALSACGAPDKDKRHAEADYVYLSPRAPGFVETSSEPPRPARARRKQLTVKEGDEVKAGALIFRLDNDRSNATRSRAARAADGLSRKPSGPILGA